MDQYELFQCVNNLALSIEPAQVKWKGQPPTTSSGSAE